jgi:hypothetical protein
MVNKALANGKRAMDPQDHGFMYGWEFLGSDGLHTGEVLWMDRRAGPSVRSKLRDAAVRTRLPVWRRLLGALQWTPTFSHMTERR